MNNARFSISETLRDAFKMAKEHFFVLAGLTLTIVFISFLLNIITQSVVAKSMMFQLPMFLVNIFIQITVTLGMIRIMMRIIDKEEYSFSDLFQPFSILTTYFVSTLLMALGLAGIMVLFFLVIFGGSLPSSMTHLILGMLVISIPLIALAIRFYFYSYLIVDRHAGIIESFTESFRITRGQTGYLLLFVLILFGINLLGLLALGIGLFFTIPMSMLALAYVYRTLLQTSEEVSEGKEDEEDIQDKDETN